MSDEVICRCTSRLLNGETRRRVEVLGEKVLFKESLKICPREVKLCTVSAIFLLSNVLDIGVGVVLGGKRVGGSVLISS